MMPLRASCWRRASFQSEVVARPKDGGKVSEHRPAKGFRHGFRLRLRLIYGPDLPVFDHQAGRGLRTRDAARPPVATAVRIDPAT